MGWIQHSGTGKLDPKTIGFGTGKPDPKAIFQLHPIILLENIFYILVKLYPMNFENASHSVISITSCNLL